MCRVVDLNELEFQSYKCFTVFWLVASIADELHLDCSIDCRIDCSLICSLMLLYGSGCIFARRLLDVNSYMEDIMEDIHCVVQLVC